MWIRILALVFIVCGVYGVDFGFNNSANIGVNGSIRSGVNATNRAFDEDISQNIFILEPMNHSEEQKRLGRHYANEGYRAAYFGSMNIARDLFYKACALGDTIGCLSLSELNAPINVDNLVAKKQECDYGVGEACFWLFRYYAGESTMDSFKTDWYLDKSCRMGVIRACELKMARFKPYIVDNYQLLGNKCYKNDAESCYALGIAHYFGSFEGKRVVQNKGYALQLIQKSCALGLKKGCNEYHRLTSWR